MSLALHPAVAEADARLSGLDRRLRSYFESDGQWECDRGGRVVWSDGDAVAAHGAPIGRFEPESPLAVAFARRTPFRGLDNGEGWRLSAVPYFEVGSGRFLGFRGHASRGGAPAPVRDLFGTGASADAFANMAHEARTPLSAIMGFAQMIESQTLGEAAADYREQASAIIRSATRLLDAVDDLASAAQLEQGRYPVIEGRTNVDELLDSMVARYAPLAARRSVRFERLAAPDLGASPIDGRLLARVFDRIASALLTVASNETLVLSARRVDDRIEVVMSRPHAIAGRSAEALLDPANLTLEAGAVAPVLGLGFGLRLASSLIAATGGLFAIEAECVRILIRGIAKQPATA